MRRVVLALALASLVPTAPAHAAGGTVTVSYLAHVVHLDNRDVIVAVCEATAHAGADVAVTTLVSCDVDGAGVTLTYAGGKAYAAIASAPGEAHKLCYSARASFYDGGFYSASAPETCVNF